MLIAGLWLHHITYRIYKALLYGIGQEHQQSVNHQWLYAGLKTKYHSNRSLLEFTAAVTNITRYHTHPFNGPLSRTARVNQYEKDKTNERQWVAVASAGPYASLHFASGSTPPLSFYRLDAFPASQATVSKQDITVRIYFCCSAMTSDLSITMVLVNCCSFGDGI